MKLKIIAENARAQLLALYEEGLELHERVDAIRIPEPEDGSVREAANPLLEVADVLGRWFERGAELGDEIFETGSTRLRWRRAFTASGRKAELGGLGDNVRDCKLREAGGGWDGRQLAVGIRAAQSAAQTHLSALLEAVERNLQVVETFAATEGLSNSPIGAGGTVFFSWQSDLPNREHRSFVGDCLKRAIKEINTQAGREAYVYDEATRGESGAVDIAQTIFQKIEKCVAVVADFSIIARSPGARILPNPNVAIELGYALRALNENQIAIVVNKASLPQDVDLGAMPFDIRNRQLSTYELPAGGDKKDARATLVHALQTHLGLLLKQTQRADN